MKKRMAVKNKKLDRKKFRKTAIKSKKMNVEIPVFRGGIRL